MLDDTKDNRSSREKFLSLPVDFPEYCSEVDTVSGQWAYCKLCKKRIPVKDNRPFTIGSWNSHRKDVKTKHNGIIAARKVHNLEDLQQRAREGTLSEKEKSRLKQDSKKQGSLKKMFKRSASNMVGVLESFVVVGFRQRRQQ